MDRITPEPIRGRVFRDAWGWKYTVGTEHVTYLQDNVGCGLDAFRMMLDLCIADTYAVRRLARAGQQLRPFRDLAEETGDHL